MQTSNKAKIRLYAHADRRGVISITRKPDERGLLPLGSGHGQAFRDIVSVVARHAYDGKTLLVAGVREADNDDEALKAVENFRFEILKRQCGTDKTSKQSKVQTCKL